MKFNKIWDFVAQGKTVCRRIHYYPDDDGDYTRPWSYWIRIRLEPDHFPSDSLIYIESNHWDERKGGWILTWGEDNLSKVDITADDWELFNAD